MLTPREISLDRAVLAALSAVPADMLLSDETLRADSARIVRPRGTVVELDARIRYLEEKRRIAGIVGEAGTQWQITDAGRLWLAQNP
jgi:hypothetical protein